MKRLVQFSSTFSIMRLCWWISSLALIQSASVFGDENLFSEGLYDPFDEWTTGPAPGSDPEPFLWSLDDDGQLIQGTDFDLASLPINDESNTDFWASCPPVGLGKRDYEAQSCTVPLRKEEIPTLPTFTDVEKAVGNPPDPEAQKGPVRENTIVPLYRPDSKCPPMNPWHLCCICDDAFALEVCQDCLLYGGLCVKPHIQVCCAVYGMQPDPGSGRLLDEWLDEGYYNPNLNTLGGVFAEDCFELYPGS